MVRWFLMNIIRLPVYLEPDELEEYKRLSKELKKHLKTEKGKLKIAESGKFIIYKRTRLLAGARAKGNILIDLMDTYSKRTKYSCVLWSNDGGRRRFWRGSTSN